MAKPGVVGAGPRVPGPAGGLVTLEVGAGVGGVEVLAAAGEFTVPRLVELAKSVHLQRLESLQRSPSPAVLLQVI